MKRLNVMDFILSLLVVALVTFTLIPAVARLQRSPAEAKCQSNMKRLAEAILLYCADHSGVFPTNRPFSGQTLGALQNMVQLSPAGVDADGKPYRFLYGITWVEALYGYVDPVARHGDSKSIWKCPAASTWTFPSGDPSTYGSPANTAATTYIMNFNLLEQFSQLIRNPQKVMMIREMDRLVNSTCRGGTNPSSGAAMQCIGASSPIPSNPFLTQNDQVISPSGNLMNNKLHGNGSYIAFADGHVGYFSVDYYPQTISAANNWDSNDQQWYNFYYANPADDTQRALNKTIAVSP